MLADFNPKILREYLKSITKVVNQQTSQNIKNSKNPLIHILYLIIYTTPVQ